jgi:DNA polymerase III epsilon subunit-like protein
MVGHDVVTDLRYLQKVGYNIWKLPQYLDEADTKTMFQRVQFALEGRSLQHLCSELDIPGLNFHNAGNDAVYTLRAMIAMAIKKKIGGPQTLSEASALENAVQEHSSK